MKLTADKLRKVVNSILEEAKKKKKPKEGEQDLDSVPGSYKKHPNFDFSTPLGSMNRYRQQGQANFGPYTGTGPDMNGTGVYGPWKTLLDYVKSMEEGTKKDKSDVEAKESPWEQAVKATAQKGKGK